MNISRLGVLVLATTLTVLTPGVADAKSITAPDAAGDVIQATGETQTKVPDRTDGDIVRSVIQHKGRRVVVTVGHADLLAPTGNQAGVHVFRIGTKKLVRNVLVYASAGRPGGAARVFKGNYRPVKCRGVHWDINYSTNVVRLSMPRRCLGKPKWVHVGIGTAKTDDQSGETYFVDDARTDGRIGGNLAWSPRAYR